MLEIIYVVVAITVTRMFKLWITIITWRNEK